MGLVLGLTMPKSADAQVPHIKWCGTVSPPYWWVPHPQIQRADHIGKKSENNNNDDKGEEEIKKPEQQL